MIRGLLISALLLSGIIPKGEAFLEQLQKRDSVLIADQVRYGFRLEDVQAGSAIALPDWSRFTGDTLVLVQDWQLDTLKGGKKASRYEIRGYVTLAAFEEGEYVLPPVSVRVQEPGRDADTLVFDPQVLQVRTMPVDTTTFVPHDIKGQIRYPLTFRELVPWILGGLLLAALAAGAVRLVRRRRNAAAEAESKDPAYIVALRRLEHWRDEKYWAPERQKQFYSGITDTLRAYIADRFAIDAQEMTTAEIFDALKGNPELTPELYGNAKELFETADFVKFAKHVAPEEYNRKAIPEAVGFVMGTYKEEPQEEKEAQ
ncbi:MAG: hypothetical protein J6Y27_03235 [Bacteroidales bacterium]|nr:hypothetical protein [Bacteroidales bacterium]MBP5389342.1 hypothetical protein [Bacteroidales bacterium]